MWTVYKIRIIKKLNLEFQWIRHDAWAVKKTRLPRGHHLYNSPCTASWGGVLFSRKLGTVARVARASSEEPGEVFSLANDGMGSLGMGQPS